MPSSLKLQSSCRLPSFTQRLRYTLRHCLKALHLCNLPYRRVLPVLPGPLRLAFWTRLSLRRSSLHGTSRYLGHPPRTVSSCQWPKHQASPRAERWLCPRISFKDHSGSRRKMGWHLRGSKLWPFTARSPASMAEASSRRRTEKGQSRFSPLI